MLHADELKCGSKRVFCAKRKCQAAFFRFIIFCGEYLTVVVESVEICTDVKNVSCDYRRLIFTDSISYHIGKYGKCLDKHKFVLAYIA